MSSPNPHALTATLGPERFLAEIKITATLQHPHILMIGDSAAMAGVQSVVNLPQLPALRRNGSEPQ
jgi:hypothetical protein